MLCLRWEGGKSLFFLSGVGLMFFHLRSLCRLLNVLVWIELGGQEGVKPWRPWGIADKPLKDRVLSAADSGHTRQGPTPDSADSADRIGPRQGLGI